ncbi:uncharacterized protein MELLADRAFT_104775 [Melampsora larici-populina 98AG31]|uniref:Uncharacterized protein n=1 Tax=Melampsora larici-populina (strain 98AG31 / pathotype 3-4-7) TaxID=747676 RepID=F4RFV4_MELLP|nr:uncharacterized protein MELLADRAFT_104775 [Melampsora larici-populina 98AG31]EGG08416.1 hypothetical protein MELLADRAFT_104775 [Melampsora larici-populina 98AG31]
MIQAIREADEKKKAQEARLTEQAEKRRARVESRLPNPNEGVTGTQTSGSGPAPRVVDVERDVKLGGGDDRKEGGDQIAIDDHNQGGGTEGNPDSGILGSKSEQELEDSSMEDVKPNLKKAKPPKKSKKKALKGKEKKLSSSESSEEEVERRGEKGRTYGNLIEKDEIGIGEGEEEEGEGEEEERGSQTRNGNDLAHLREATHPLHQVPPHTGNLIVTRRGEMRKAQGFHLQWIQTPTQTPPAKTTVRRPNARHQEGAKGGGKQRKKRGGNRGHFQNYSKPYQQTSQSNGNFQRREGGSGKDWVALGQQHASSVASGSGKGGKKNGKGDGTTDR